MLFRSGGGDGDGVRDGGGDGGGGVMEVMVVHL